ncbi:MAG: ATP-binding protein [Ilumatobacteraceae bacterium]
MLPRSIRARTTVVAVVAVGAALGIGAIGLTGLLHNRLLDSVDHAARARANDVAALVAEGAAPARFDLPGERDNVVQVVDEHGVVVSSTNSDLTGAITKPSGADTAVFNVTLHRRDHSVHLRAAAVTVHTARGQFVVYATQSREEADETSLAVTLALLAGIPILVTLVGALTWRATRRALIPVHEITAEVALITDDALNRRVPVPDSGDEITELAVSMNSMLERVDTSMQRQRRFTADASHELRSPLSSLRAQLDVAVLESGEVSVADAAPGLFAELDRLDRLVVDLLALARIDSEAGPTEPIDIIDVVREVCTRRQATTSITTQMPDHAMIVLGAREQLARAIRNVLDNADRHAFENISVAVHSEAGHVIVDISDDGEGIDPRDRERIFERFTRLDEARATDDGGAGLGLAITRQIINSHHGTVTATHRRDGLPGALIMISIPLAADLVTKRQA